MCDLVATCINNSVSLSVNIRDSEHQAKMFKLCMGR